MRKIFLFIFTALVVSLFAAGCSSTGRKSTEAEQADMPEMTRPPAAEFRIGVGDTLDIAVYRNDDLKTSTKINPSGTILFPLIGEVQAAGRTIPELRDELRTRFSKYLVDPQITISVASIQSQKVLLLGEVKNPGVFTLDSELTVMDAMAKAGGWTQDANLQNVVLLRNAGGKVKTWSLDMKALVAGSALTNNYLLQRNDVVYVPTRKIADISRFMTYIGNILSPIVLAEGGIVLWPQVIDALKGETSGSVAIPTR